MQGFALAMPVSFNVFLRVAVRDRFGIAEPLSHCRDA
ncbi:hypothetical protein MESS2_1340050 [Mesorhizobium metallidurans STM 2683]|uniref:Uncharacterized protein n=1 Tax=Mesorhizobium metallidurans STM 2683 TaxID=1297569 RepID=M5EJV3_9HYPH|nr:hypothetical protein MESS2_1340050 [Mesorhizobium metallidurans STM 2683]